MKLIMSNLLALVAIGIVGSTSALRFRNSNNQGASATSDSKRDVAPDIAATIGIGPVPDVNVSQFLGRWYQMYTDLINNQTVEKNGKCLTADYGLFSNGSISVYNAQRMFTPNGSLESIKGYAFREHPNSAPAKLSIVLFGGPPFPAPFWIVKLGPQNYGHENLYSYAVVTAPLELDLFVLARNPADFRKNHEQSVLTWLQNNGFTNFWNKPNPVYQEPDCEYAPRPGFALA